MRKASFLEQGMKPLVRVAVTYKIFVSYLTIPILGSPILKFFQFIQSFVTSIMLQCLILLYLYLFLHLELPRTNASCNLFVFSSYYNVRCHITYAQNIGDFVMPKQVMSAKIKKKKSIQIEELWICIYRHTQY